jgi:chaperone modulatory protein CbpM
METTTFRMHARVDVEALEAWIESGWLMPKGEGTARSFSDIDLARAQLIRDLKKDLGVNDEGIDLILDLVDQLHGLRRTLRELLYSIRAQPEAMRRQIVADIRAAAPKRPGGEPDRERDETQPTSPS